MFPRFILPLLLTASCGWFTSCSSPATTPAGTGVARTSDAPTPKEEGAFPEFPKLEKGMSAEAIRKKVGEPAEIKPMESPGGGKAEVWIYKFETDLGIIQVAGGTRDVTVMVMTGNGPALGTVKDPVYTQAERKGDVTMTLLLFNDQLEAQKAQVKEVIQHR